MLAVVGFAVGYVMGARAGQEGLDHVMQSARQVLASDEFKAMVETARSVAASAMREGFGRIAGMAFGEARDLGSRLRAA